VAVEYATGVVSAPEDRASDSGGPREDPRDPPKARTEYRQMGFRRFPGATQFLLIRHGETVPYVPGTPFPETDGHGDPPLGPQGFGQAERLADRLASANIDAIYVSSLQRTLQTAQPLADRLGLVPKVEPDLREVYLGEWDNGLYRQMAAEHHPLAVKAWTEERWDVIPGAEPGEAFAARVRGSIARLAATHPDQQLAVFSHGGVIGQVLAYACGSRPFAFTSCDNASISRLVVIGERWVVRGFNDTAHLDPPPDGPEG
jgi:2,3-bisphosphoglycerate-dependent phosphoglycerate mutase